MSQSNNIDVEISELIKSSDVSQVLQRCEEIEIEHGWNADENLSNARFLWKRTPKEKKESTELAAIWKIGQHMWKRDYTGVYEALKAKTWSGNLDPLINKLNESFRIRIMKLLSSAYSNISIQDAAKFLGRNENETRELINSFGWESGEGDYLVPHTLEENEMPDTADLNRISRLAEASLFLEFN